MVKIKFTFRKKKHQDIDYSYFENLKLQVRLEFAACLIAINQLLLSYLSQYLTSPTNSFHH